VNNQQKIVRVRVSNLNFIKSNVLYVGYHMRTGHPLIIKRMVNKSYFNIASGVFAVEYLDSQLSFRSSTNANLIFITKQN
jgi:hypothetical protein